MSRSKEMDLTVGNPFRSLLKFAIPVILGNLFQLFYTLADSVIVGKTLGADSLAAVGSTSIIIYFVFCFINGFTGGFGICLGQRCGAKDEKGMRKSVAVSTILSIVFTVVLTLLCCLFAHEILYLMQIPSDISGEAYDYMFVVLLGTGATVFYNMISNMLRALGDSKTPLYFLVFSSILNIFLDLFFILVFHMGVAGAAIATVISQVISAGLVAICLMKTNASYRLELHKLHIYKDKFFGMMRVGLPAGMQGAVFSISNVLIQSSINSFGSTVMAGSTAAANIEGFVYTAMNAFYQTALSFTGQNMGAKKYDRVAKILRICILCVTVTGVVLGCGAYLLGTPLLSIYTSDPEVIQYGLERMLIVCVPYFLCGIMDTHVGVLRGMGYSIMPMIVSLTGACALRVVWILTVFQMNRTLFMLFLSYPVTWAVTAAAHFVCYLIVHHKMMEKAKAEQAEAAKA